MRRAYVPGNRTGCPLAPGDHVGAGVIGRGGALINGQGHGGGGDGRALRNGRHHRELDECPGGAAGLIADVQPVQVAVLHPRALQNVVIDDILLGVVFSLSPTPALPGWGHNYATSVSTYSLKPNPNRYSTDGRS